MKKLICCIAFCLITNLIRAQIWACPNDVNDTTAPMAFDSTSFENDTIAIYKIKIDTTNAFNIWQIGLVSKLGFDTAYDGMRAMQTDSVLSYPINNTSAFDVWIEEGQQPFGDVFSLQWRQKFDVSYMQDSCIIQYTSDSGKTWFPIFSSNGSLRVLDTIHEMNNGQIFYTGNSNGWQLASLCFTRYAVKSTINRFYGVRFLFKSDSIFDNKPGWMIDDVKFGEIGFIKKSSIYDSNKPSIAISPNPASSSIQISNAIGKQVQLINQYGQVLQTQSIINNNATLQVANLPKGLYLVKTVWQVAKVVVR